MWAPQIFQNDNSIYENLISGQIPAIIIPEIISKFDCENLCNKILLNQYITSGPGISNKIGTSLSSHIYEKSKYFSNSQKSNQLIQHIFANTKSIMYEMHLIINKVLSIEINLFLRLRRMIFNE